jgi:hypothetical protein
MSRITDRAIRKYQASVTSAADIRAVAAMTLREVLDAEIAR